MSKRPKRDVISAELRAKVLKRDGCACRYCYSTKGPFHMDHVYPFSKGGETTYANLVTACARCNVKKGARVGLWPRPLKDIKIRRHRVWPVMKNEIVNRNVISAWILENTPDVPRELPAVVKKKREVDYVGAFATVIVSLFSAMIFIPSVFYAIVHPSNTTFFVMLSFSLLTFVAISAYINAMTARKIVKQSAAEGAAK